MRVIIKKNDRPFLTDEGQNLIMQRVGKEPVLVEKEDEPSGKEDDLIKTIQETLKEKDNQIERLQTLLNQQQQLNAKDKELFAELRQQPLIEDSSSQDEIDSLEKKVQEQQIYIEQLEKENQALEEMNQEWSDQYDKLEYTYLMSQEKKKKRFGKKNKN
ncbi:hypothetical protein [Enterococcus sp. AZ103]|uniref:hypothetical protein n=1 Tax=Enterococcus sp. AZ103 TaxID=2774628 RepID=UPI003F682D97